MIVFVWVLSALLVWGCHGEQTNQPPAVFEVPGLSTITYQTSEGKGIPAFIQGSLAWQNSESVFFLVKVFIKA
jgi:hypothetical protein